MPKKGGVSNPASKFRQTRKPVPRRTRAYAPHRKKKFQKKRQPFVESKNRTGEEVWTQFHGAIQDATLNPVAAQGFVEADPAADSIAVFNIPLYSLNAQKQTLKEDGMIGQSIFAKYLKCKVHFQFPLADALSKTTNPSVFLIHGFINNAPHNTPIAANAAWSLAQDNAWVLDQIKPYLDERVDKLRYIPKRQSNLQILGYRRINPNLRKGIAIPVTATAGALTDEQVGSIPDMYTSVKWPMMKKIHYTESSSTTWVSAADSYLYVNEQKRPFVVLYCPQFDGLNVFPANLPTIKYNDILYYSDS